MTEPLNAASDARVVITGGAGFLGARLAGALLARGRIETTAGPRSIGRVVLVDVVEPAASTDARIERRVGDIADPAFVASLVAGDEPLSVFHLAAVVSAHAEQDFDLAMRVNVDAVRTLLEALRRRGDRPRFASTSSVAVFGSDVGDEAGESSPVRPETTYGMTKALLELLAADYARKGFVDARIARLPTVIIRPGAPNGAASSAASAVFREPLAGIDYVLPVDPATRIAVASVRNVIDGILALHDAPAVALEGRPVVALPSRSVSFAEMIDALDRVASDRALGRIDVTPDTAIQRMVASWPSTIDAPRAALLGLPEPDPLDRVVADYTAEHPRHPA